MRSSLVRLGGVIGVLALLGGVVGLALAWNAGRTYTSTAAVYVKVSNVEGASDVTQVNTFVNDQLKSWAVVALSPVTLNRVVTSLHSSLSVDEIRERVVVSGEANTTILRVVARGDDPAEAQGLARSVSEELRSDIGKNSPVLPNGKRVLDAAFVEEAAAPSGPSGMSLGTGSGVGALIGGVIGVCLLIVYSVVAPYWSRWRDESRDTSSGSGVSARLRPRA